MRNLFTGIIISSFVFASASALADDTTLINEMQMKTLTPAQSAQLKAERDAAKAKWATMTPAEKAAATQSMKNKKIADMNHMDKFAQNDDMMAMTKSETAKDKAEREASEAKYAKMTPDEKAALRKSTQQKRLADMNSMERTSQNDDMGRYMSY